MDYLVAGADLQAVADAIRLKGGTSSPITFPNGWITAIGQIGGGDLWSWMGRNPIRLYQSNVETTLLSDTAWASWTPTTTATALTSAAAYTTFSANMTNYDYLIHFQMYEALSYNGNATNKALLNKACIDQWAICTRYSTNRANLISGTRNGNNAVSVLSQAVMDYYNTSGNLAVAYSWGYGFYPSAPTPTFSSSTSATPTITVRIPAYNARCSTSYLTVANAGCVLGGSSYYKTQFEVWQVDAGTSALRYVQDKRMELYNNGL